MSWTYSPPSPAEITEGGLALREYVGAQAEDKEFSEETFSQAHALVYAYIGGSPAVPETIIDNSIKEVGSKLWARRGTQGNTGFGDSLEGQPQFAAKDPMVTVYAVLDRFTAGGFA